MTAGWDFAPACRPTVRRSPSPLGLGESHSFQRPIPKPPEPPVGARSSQTSKCTLVARKAGTGGARRHVDRRGRPRVRRAPEGGQDRGSSRRARPRPAGAPSAAERALRAIAAAKFDLGPRAREPFVLWGSPRALASGSLAGSCCGGRPWVPSPCRIGGLQ